MHTGDIDEQDEEWDERISAEGGSLDEESHPTLLKARDERVSATKHLVSSAI